MKRTVCFLVVLMMVTVSASIVRADDDAVLAALRAELDRDRAQLTLPGYAAPYFIAYRATQDETYSLNATLGAILGEGGGTERKVYVEVRVGDYAFDNTSTRSEFDRFDPDLDTFDYLQYVDLPTDNDPAAIRARLWRLTDLKFKNALAEYLGKKAQAVYRENPDAALADFARQEPARHVDPPLDAPFQKDLWRALAREASALFLAHPEILDSQVTVQLQRRTRYLLTTEGTQIVTRAFYFLFFVDARTLTPDGMSVQHHFGRYARTVAREPGRDEILAGVGGMIDELLALRLAPVLEPYTGPALLDPSVAAVFVHEAIGHRLEGDRTRGIDEGQTFKGKIGQMILPDFLDLSDDPTRREMAGAELFGQYDYDDEGVPAQPVELVAGGRLLNFLRSRTPILGGGGSNGHGRADATQTPMSRMGNTIVTARRTLSPDRLKDKLLALARAAGKPFALHLRHGMGGETSTDQFNFQAFANRPVLLYRIDAKTGREELVRGAEVVGTPLLSISKVVAAGEDPGVFNGFCGAESGFIPVSAVSPSLLVSEIELQRIQDKPTKPPILPAPYAK